VVRARSTRFEVSIRSRRRGREKHGAVVEIASDPLFQSAPDAEAGRNGWLTCPNYKAPGFQSAPDAEAGRNISSRLAVVT